MEHRTVVRFRKRAILIHWLHMGSFAILLNTGALMFFRLTGFHGGQEIRLLHSVTAVFFVAMPVLYSLSAPAAAGKFLREAFQWNADDVLWLKLSRRYYFGHREEMPPQGRINGDQKLWQLIVIVTGVVSTLTGIILWFFKLKIPIEIYGWVLLAHAAAFILVSAMFMLHFYLRTLHPRFGESLSSMLDGKVSESYAREHYDKWYNPRPEA